MHIRNLPRAPTSCGIVMFTIIEPAKERHLKRRQCMALAGAFALGALRPQAGLAAAPQRLDGMPDAFPAFNGVVLSGRGGDVLACRTFGVADGEAAIAMRTDTRFEAGSVSKWIAAMVVMKLADLGKLALDVAISGYLPDYRADTGAQITLRHLMSHSSGVPNDLIAARRADPRLGFVALDQMAAVARYASGDLRFAPGSAWDYSHSNWLIVKAIVERVSKTSYAECVTRYLTGPLGLKDSGLFTGDSSAVPGMAVGYAGAQAPWQRKVSAIPDYMVMAGGYYTSAPDLLRLMDGVLDGAVLSAASRQALMRVNMPEQHYALGGRTRVETIAGKPREAAWEDGSNGGFRLLARRVLADGHTVIVCNNTSFDYEKLGRLGAMVMAAEYD
jgi:CubicO group peptidase (beta-lactamase class C family)